MLWMCYGLFLSATLLPLERLEALEQLDLVEGELFDFLQEQHVGLPQVHPLCRHFLRRGHLGQAAVLLNMGLHLPERAQPVARLEDEVRPAGVHLHLAGPHFSVHGQREAGRVVGADPQAAVRQVDRELLAQPHPLSVRPGRVKLVVAGDENRPPVPTRVSADQAMVQPFLIGANNIVGHARGFHQVESSLQAQAPVGISQRQAAPILPGQPVKGAGAVEDPPVVEVELVDSSP